MQSGVLDTETLPNVLRDLSQKRKQGVLEIRTAQSKVSVCFILGKIVDVVRGDTPPCRDLVARLVDAGAIPDDLELSSASGYTDLLARLKRTPDGQFLNEEIFSRALRHLVLDKVYELATQGGTSFHFKSQMVECDRSIVPSLSVGQILLDMVSLTSDRAKFESMVPPGHLIFRIGSGADRSLSEEEEIVFEMAREGLTREELCRRSLLSRYHLQDALIALVEHGLIKVVDPKSAALSEDLDQSSLAVDPELQSSKSREPRRESSASSHSMQVAPSSAHAPVVESKYSLRKLNLALLHSDNIPRVVLYGFLVSAIIIPLFMWRDVILRFK